MDMSQGREVLPTNVKPVHYDLTLEPNLEKFTFEGTVIIEYVQSCGVLQVRRDIVSVPLCPRSLVSVELISPFSIVLKLRKIRIQYP